MIGVIAVLRVQPDKTNAFEMVFAELAALVSANEPGNQLYQLTRTRGEPGVYKVIELYADQDAMTAHSQSDHFKATGAKLGAFLLARPEIELLDAVGG